MTCGHAGRAGQALAVVFFSSPGEGALLYMTLAQYSINVAIRRCPIHTVYPTYVFLIYRLYCDRFVIIHARMQPLYIGYTVVLVALRSPPEL